MSLPARLLLIDPGGTRREIQIQATPFKMGRQQDNELTLRDNRISRLHAQIVAEDGRLVIEDLQSRHGTFVNGQKIQRQELHPKDEIDFGVPDSYRLIFLGQESSLEEILQRVETPAPPSSSRELYHLGVLLEVARVLHTGMSLEDALSTVVDAAIQVTGTERGVLLLRNAAGELETTVARDARRHTLDPKELQISSSVVRQVADSRRELIVTDTGSGSGMAQQASVVRLALHTIVAIPLEKLPRMGSYDTTIYAKPAELVGVLYLDSHSPGKNFSEMDREVLRSLALEAATVIENAKLFAAARAKERIEHELQIASEIQQRLLPRCFPKAEHCSITGVNIACQSIGGDFFDVIPLGSRRLGMVVADVSGKGIGAALLASMLQGTFCATASMDVAVEAAANRVNQYLCERSGDDRYATLFYGVLDTTGRLDYINAGHVPPLVRTAMGQIYPLASENFPLGMFDFAEYQSERVVLKPGDFLVAYTDGVTEARNASEDLFGEERLQEVVRSFAGSTVEELSQAVRQAVREFTGGAPQSDDFTLLVLQYKGKPA